MTNNNQLVQIDLSEAIARLHAALLGIKYADLAHQVKICATLLEGVAIKLDDRALRDAVKRVTTLEEA